MPPKKKARAFVAQPTAAETKAARRAESVKCILALERKAKDEASTAAAAAAAAAETEQQLQDLRDAQTGDTSSEEETERPTGGSSSQRSLNNELAQRLEAQAEEIKELKEIVYSRRTHDVAGRREASRREASRRGSSGHPLSVMSPSPASKRARGTAPERSRRTHSEQEETFSDDDDSLSEVRGDIRERANRLSRGQEGALANLNDDPNFGEYESEEESDGESIAGSDVDDAEGGDGSLAKHAMKSVVLEKKLIHDQECRDLSATPYRHWAGKQAAMAALKRQYSINRTIAVMWRVLTSLKKAFPRAVSVETPTDDAGYKIRNHPAFLAATSELQYLRMQKLLAEGDRTAITVTDVCDDPQAAMNYINQQWSLKKNKPSEYLNTIIAASKSAAFVKFLKEKPASSSRQQSRKSQREERFYSDGEDDEDDKHAGAMVVFQGGKQGGRQNGKKNKRSKAGNWKGGKGGGGGGAATKP